MKVIDVNCRAPLAMAHHFARKMVPRGRGGILLMSSLAGGQGTPIVAAYAASKAFEIVLAEGLWDELGPSGVDVVACRAGPTRTPAYEASRPRKKVPMMEPMPVAEEALAALGRKPVVVAGRLNRAVDFVMRRLLTRPAAIRFMGKHTRDMYE
jgi:short-subunit dehydrogenase